MNGAIDPPNLKTKTIVVGLKDALIDHDNVGKIGALVSNMAETKFHASNILALYANQVCQSKTRGDALQHIEPQFRNDGEIFNANIINHAIAIVHSAKRSNDNIPLLLLRVANEYLSGSLFRFQQKVELEHTKLREEMRASMVISFKNCMEISTPLNQKSTFRRMYDLSSKEADIVCAHVSTSTEKRRENAKVLHLKRFI